MSYVVNWRGPDGQAGWHPVSDLSEAAGHVEHLRNVEGVGETKIFKLDEVQFEFRQYFRVELADESPAPAPVAAPTFSVPAAVEPAPEPAPEPAAEVAWAPEPAAEAPVLPEVPTFEAAPEPVLAEVGADDGGSNGQRRGLFGR